MPIGVEYTRETRHQRLTNGIGKTGFNQQNI